MSGNDFVWDRLERDVERVAQEAERARVLVRDMEADARKVELAARLGDCKVVSLVTMIIAARLDALSDAVEKIRAIAG